MSILIDTCSVAIVAPPRLRVSLGDLRLHADDAQPRRLSRPAMPSTAGAWRVATGSTTRGYEATAKQETQDGRTGFAGAYVAANKHFSIRSGPPTSRPPA